MMTTEQAARPRGRLRRLVHAGLTYRRLPLLLAAAGMLLTLPALWAGLIADDFFHRRALVNAGGLGGLRHSSAEMFRFFDGDPAHFREMLERGFLPWWTYPGIKGAFWRPLTVTTHWLDYRLWPDSPALMHLHSILWYGALVLVAGRMYRRLMPSALGAGLAALLYAVDHTHAMPVAFLANRNTLISALFGVLALLAHDRWRRDRRLSAALIAPIMLLHSLLAKEEGLATCAYLAAYALFIDRGNLRKRCLSLLPAVAVVVGWRILWVLRGYGIADVGLYVDPLRDPARYATAVIAHLPCLLLGQWAGPPAESSLMNTLLGSATVQGVWWAGVAFPVLLAVILWPLLRRDAIARFWALGMLLSLLPVCATFPADRLLVFSGLGAMGLLARFLEGVFGGAAWQPAGRVWRKAAVALAGLLVFLHVIIAPGALVARTAYAAGPRIIEQFAVRLPLDASIAEQDVVLVNPPSVLYAVYFPAEREAAGLPPPRRIRILAPGIIGVTVHRADAHTLVIRAAGGYFAWTFDQLLRDERHPLKIGDRVALSDMTAEVTSLTPDGRPADASFRFVVPLEDASLRWLCWRDGEWGPFTPPAVGESVALPGVPPWW
jgi:hypothetical protein